MGGGIEKCSHLPHLEGQNFSLGCRRVEEPGNVPFIFGYKPFIIFVIFITVFFAEVFKTSSFCGRWRLMRCLTNRSSRGFRLRGMVSSGPIEVVLFYWRLVIP